jgi:hypothetical protein
MEDLNFQVLGHASKNGGVVDAPPPPPPKKPKPLLHARAFKKIKFKRVLEK